MKFDMTSIDGAAAGSLDLNDEVFGLEPRADLIARMVRWQLAKRLQCLCPKCHAPGFGRIQSRRAARPL